jgi:glutamate N-acetyltransferase/amino-acid N-acetyltransferase
MSHAVSPLASPFPALPAIAGATPRVARAHYKEWDRCDLTYVELAEGTAVAGVFTRNICCSSEVELGRANVKQGRARALIVNAGNSNAFTGYRGREAVEQIMDQVATHLGCAKEQVFVSSTGVIGVPLPKDKARAGVDNALSAQPCSWEDAANTIGTTDTFAKGATATAIVGGKTVTLSAIIKGSGMIAPDMATMLGYIFTDAPSRPACRTADQGRRRNVQLHHGGQRHLDQRHGAGLCHRARRAMTRSLRRVPRRRCLCRRADRCVPPTGASGGARWRGRAEIHRRHRHRRGLDESARKVGLPSPTRRWSRPPSRARTPIGAASSWPWARPANRPTATSSPSALAAPGGQGRPALADYDEAPVAEHLEGQRSTSRSIWALGEGRATVWTCDLTHGYISINADYRS